MLAKCVRNTELCNKAEFVTNDKEILKKSFYELVDELYERIKNNKYHFRTVGIKLMKTDFSVETKE